MHASLVGSQHKRLARDKQSASQGASIVATEISPFRKPACASVANWRSDREAIVPYALVPVQLAEVGVEAIIRHSEEDVDEYVCVA